MVISPCRLWVARTQVPGNSANVMAGGNSFNFTEKFYTVIHGLATISLLPGGVKTEQDPDQIIF